LTLQKANTHVINWILNLHWSFNIEWFTQWVDSICVCLHTGTCKSTLPVRLSMGQDKICLRFHWKPVYDGKNKEQWSRLLPSMWSVRRKTSHWLEPSQSPYSLAQALLKGCHWSSILPRAFRMIMDQLNDSSSWRPSENIILFKTRLLPPWSWIC
jgi:hypothetical protein